MQALLSGSEVLVFVDTDVYPRVLVKENNQIKEKEIDFFGRHLEYLQKEEVIITTSDYSGYYIIPPMNFSGMKELFLGLQKEDAYEFLINSEKHNCLNLDNDKKRKVFETDKIFYIQLEDVYNLREGDIFRLKDLFNIRILEKNIEKNKVIYGEYIGEELLSDKM